MVCIQDILSLANQGNETNLKHLNLDGLTSASFALIFDQFKQQLSICSKLNFSYIFSPLHLTLRIFLTYPLDQWNYGSKSRYPPRYDDDDDDAAHARGYKDEV